VAVNADVYTALDVSPPSLPNAFAAKRPPRWPGWLREPLLHFVVLGGLLFAVDHALLSKNRRSHTITVGADVDSEAIETFRGGSRQAAERSGARGPAPSVAGTTKSCTVKARAAGRQGRPAIRERVIFKGAQRGRQQRQVAAPGRQNTQHLVRSPPRKYDEPALRLRGAALSGDSSEAAFPISSRVSTAARGVMLRRGCVIQGRPHLNLVQSYGPEFAKDTRTSPQGVWQAQSTHDGWRAMRLNALTAPEAGSIHERGGVVLQDWTTQRPPSSAPPRCEPSGKSTRSSMSQGTRFPQSSSSMRNRSCSCC